MPNPSREPIRHFLPGPAYVPEAARQALTKPIVGHRSAEFRRLYASLAERLPRLFRTSGEVYLATGSATLVMEMAILSAVERPVLHLTCGAFSERWLAISRSWGKEADAVAVPWGEAVEPDLVRAALGRKRYDAVTLVHNETSTGAISPAGEIARAVREESDALLLVDAVSSLGGAPVETDAWGADLVLAGCQKALALPPGLVLFHASERLLERAARLPHRGFYTDLLRYRDKHRQGGTITTPAIPLVYALDHQLDRVLAEGLENRWQRHRDLAERTLSWAAESGFEPACREGARSPTVTCLEPPRGVAARELVAALGERGFTVAGGYGAWKESTFRIGHMGEVRRADLDPLLEAVRREARGLVRTVPLIVETS